MSWRNTLTLTVAIGASVVGTGLVFSQDGGKAPTPEEMDKILTEMAKPVEQHRTLAADAGAWDAEVTMFGMDPSQPPTKSKGTSTVRSIHNGLHVTEEFKGEFMGKPYEGFGLRGFSKEKQKWFGVWSDSIASTPEVVWGTADASGKVVTFDGELMTCPMGDYTPRWILRRDDADHMTFEHWAKHAGAADYQKGLEIRYTRRK
jgi:hypothetical protein